MLLVAAAQGNISAIYHHDEHRAKGVAGEFRLMSNGVKSNAGRSPRNPVIDLF